MRFFMMLVLSPLFIQAKAPQALAFVSSEKLSGLWYEIARTFNEQQEDCVASSVEYIYDKEDDDFTVYNRCFEKVIGGDLIEYEGYAKGINNLSVSEIMLRYYYVIRRNFRIIYLSEDEKTAVMSDAAMDKVWIMHKAPQIKDQELQKVQTMLAKNMNLQRLIFTPQDEKGRYK